MAFKPFQRERKKAFANKGVKVVRMSSYRKQEIERKDTHIGKMPFECEGRGQGGNCTS